MSLLKPILKYRSMRFPPFDQNLHESIIQHQDYYRYSTYGLAINRIINDNISGSFAEVGVYKGEMSKFIQAFIPGTRFYLFDTFEGFPERDLELNEDPRFRDTNVDLILSKLNYSKNIVIRKGYVPETFKGLENEKFSFVLLDLDLYGPTLKSLEFFYSKLNIGGYLIVHDYNSPESNFACHRAVDEFFKDKPEKPIEIADNWGSILFRKI